MVFGCVIIWKVSKKFVFLFKHHYLTNLKKCMKLSTKISNLSQLAALSLLLTGCISESDSSGIKYGEDFIVFEAEASIDAIPENWVIRREGNVGYEAIKSPIPSVAGTYIEYVGGTSSGLGVDAGIDVLRYKFTPKVSGIYSLSGRMGQQLNQPEGEARKDWCNDIYVKMEGNFTSGNDETPLEVLQEWNKFYGRGYNAWGSFAQGDVGHTKYSMDYNLTAGEEYIFSMSGRSTGVTIDYMIFSIAPIKAVTAEDFAANNSETMRPDGVESGKYSSISFDQFTGWGGDFADATIDKRRRVLQMPSRLKWGAAETTFKGKSGRYDVTLNTMLESDGESEFKVYVDGNLIGEVVNTRSYGTDIEDYTPAAHKIGDGKVSVKSGSIIRVEFSSATNGMVPEGELTATSRGRWQSIVFE